MGRTVGNAHLILPIGTQVVTRGPVRTLDGRAVIAGSVGVVVHVPVDATHSYQVRFPDGSVSALRRSQVSIRKQVQNEGLGEVVPPELRDWDLTEYVVYRCIVGSTAYGLTTEDSDVDRRGIFLPSADIQWSLYRVPEQIESRVPDEVYWEIQKFFVLALKANPNVLECLYTPIVELSKPPIEEVLAQREVFLSKLVYQTYNGYVLSQFQRLEQDLRATSEIRWKHAMHLIRLLLSGIAILREGFVPLDVGPHREQLLEIRAGRRTWEEVDRWRLQLHGEFDRAYEGTALPDRPDYSHANMMLIDARRSMV
jgi:uncharacterized protein